MKPNPKNTLVIILGASLPPTDSVEEAVYGDKRTGQIFLSSAEGVKEYFLDKNGFNLPRENLLDLFDDENRGIDQITIIKDFISNKSKLLNSLGLNISDLILYFIGHGVFVDESSEFVLAIRNSDGRFAPSSIQPKYLATRIRSACHKFRRFIFLDCCYAAKALTYFQSSPEAIATKQIKEDFSRPGHFILGLSGFIPTTGTFIVSATGARKPIPIDEHKKHTIFTDALLNTLQTGSHKINRNKINLRELEHLINIFLTENYHNPIWPEFNHAETVDGLMNDVPIFPNLSYKKRGSPEFDKKRVAIAALTKNNQINIESYLQSIGCITKIVQTHKQVFKTISSGECGGLILTTSFLINNADNDDVLIRLWREGFEPPTAIVLSKTSHSEKARYYKDNINFVQFIFRDAVALPNHYGDLFELFQIGANISS